MDRINIFKPIIIIITLFLCGLCGEGIAKTHVTLAEKTKELSALKSRIQNLNKTVSQTKNKQQLLSHELQHTDISINNVSINLQQTQHQWTKEKEKLQLLEVTAEELQRSLQEQIGLLRQQIRATYQLGQQEYIKLLLNQQDPSQMSRLLTYYGYLSRERNKIIIAIQHKLTLIQNNQAAISQQTKKLSELIETHKHQLNVLTLSKQYQNNVIEKLSEEITTNTQKIAALENNQKSLEQLIKTLRLSPDEFMRSLHPFATMQHHLQLPTEGKITVRFGETIDHSQMKSNGLFIQSQQDQDVHAIYGGRVIFANWMRGFGLMLILDHGHGYLSLYAYNNTLYHKVGDLVHGGDLIAKVGHSGGQSVDGLYVEVRHNGKPLNPEVWLARNTA